MYGKCLVLVATLVAASSAFAQQQPGPGDPPPWGVTNLTDIRPDINPQLAGNQPGYFWSDDINAAGIGGPALYTPAAAPNSEVRVTSLFGILAYPGDPSPTTVFEVLQMPPAAVNGQTWAMAAVSRMPQNSAGVSVYVEVRDAAVNGGNWFQLPNGQVRSADTGQQPGS